MLAAVLALTGTAVGTWLVHDHRSTAHGASGAATLSPSPTATRTTLSSPSGPLPSDSGSGTPAETPTTPEGTPSSLGTEPTPGGVPTGFTRTQDPAGFTLDVPTGWTRSVDGPSVFYNEPGGIGLVQVYPVAAPTQTPYEALKATSQNLAAKPGFQLLSLARLGAADDSPAELQYSYQGTAHDQRRAVDRAFTAPDGVQYSILARATTQVWPLQQTWLDTAVQSFCPTSTCSTP